MKTRTVTVREGEYLGPVDWDFDFDAAGWDHGGSFNPKLIAGRVEMLRRLAADPDRYEATTDGGIPRCGWGRVLQVGMYDGWPYWKPVPSVLLSTWAGAEWHSWSCLVEIKETIGQ